MPHKPLFTVVVLLLFSNLEAVVYQQISNTRILRCTFSSKHQNRIVVHHGRVRKVICPEGLLSIQMEEESGQVFMYPLVEHIQGEITLSVVTDNGFVQDLEVQFANTSSEVVVLVEPDPNLHQHYSQKRTDCRKKRLSFLITALLRGKLPRGFAYCNGPNAIHRIGKGVRATRIYTLQNPCECLLVFEIKNCSLKSQIIEEPALAQLGCKWVFLQKNCLKPWEKCLGVVAVDKR